MALILGFVASFAFGLGYLVFVDSGISERQLRKLPRHVRPGGTTRGWTTR